jgi:hypothetical protein
MSLSQSTQQPEIGQSFRDYFQLKETFDRLILKAEHFAPNYEHEATAENVKTLFEKLNEVEKLMDKLRQDSK